MLQAYLIMIFGNVNLICAPGNDSSSRNFFRSDGVSAEKLVLEESVVSEEIRSRYKLLLIFCTFCRL